MNCTKCGSATVVIDTEKFSMSVWRRRRCVKCKFRFNTQENLAEDVQNYRGRKPQAQPQPTVQKPKLKVVTPPAAPVEPLPVRNTRKQIEDIREYLELRKREREDTDD